ncbi:MAG: mandelate racemase/muconate lactonizing enzyme family protein [Phycisphaerae bacterium]|nr:mandelate racemase/muconate lactonizing enzyme family protein [Phycisphaerae bacterium]
MKKQPQSDWSRRALLKGLGLGGLSLAGILGLPIEEQVACATQGVSRASQPSQLRITDLRVAVITGAPMRVPLIRIDTNQGICGYGEVRDGASKRYALMLKSRLLGENPCDVERIFKAIRQFGYHGRQGGGVSGVEMALWDLAGKAYGVPVYRMLGGKYRDRVRLYADTPSVRDKDRFAEKLKERMKMGFSFLKMDLGINLIRNVPGALSRPPVADGERYRTTMHPFTRIQLTDKGIAMLAEYVAQVRKEVGNEIPLAADHFGQVDVNSCIRLGKALEPYQMAWLEDMVPWQYTEMLKEITSAINVPTLTGEDIYCLSGFKELIDQRAVDMIQPDLATAGGILETKRIGDYAQERGVPMAMHFAGSPISFLANVHCAAATENVVALEHHGVDVPWWEDLVTGVEKPLNQKGLVRVPETPGLGVELNLEVVKQHLARGEECFGPTDEWNSRDSNDRLWS